VAWARWALPSHPALNAEHLRAFLRAGGRRAGEAEGDSSFAKAISRLQEAEAERAELRGDAIRADNEAMASVLAAIDRAGDPLSRSSVVDAYFDGTERDSVLGTYSITAEGETTLDAPLAAYYVEAGALVPER
jgi:hypothetical protein